MKIVMKIKSYNCIFLFCIILSGLGCYNKPKRNIFYGNNCKLWLIQTSVDSGYSWEPNVICFDENHCRGYRILRTGKLREMMHSDVKSYLTDGGKWELSNDTLFVSYGIYPLISFNNDTIVFDTKVYKYYYRRLFNVTDKFEISNCNCHSLEATLKGKPPDDYLGLLDTIFGTHDPNLLNR